MTMDEFAEYSRLYDTFGLKGKKVSKGKYKGIDLVERMYPHFGFLQFQPIGNKQNFSELQFNLKSNYYKTFKKLKDQNNMEKPKAPRREKSFCDREIFI